MRITGREMSLKELKEEVEKFVNDGVADDGLVVWNFTFEIPKIFEKLVESMEENIYGIGFYFMFPLDAKYKLASFSLDYFADIKELIAGARVEDIRQINHVKYSLKKFMLINVSLTRVSNFPKIFELLDKYPYRGFFDLSFNISEKGMGGGRFYIYAEDFIVDFAYYGKVL
jgi:hypothetical protein